jgi:hypothetical protein
VEDLKGSNLGTTFKVLNRASDKECWLWKDFWGGGVLFPRQEIRGESDLVKEEDAWPNKKN